MSEGSKWTPGKIFLVVIAAVVGLGILCCGGIWLGFGDQIKAVYSIAADSKEFHDSLRRDLGKAATFGVEQKGKREWNLTIGVEGELTPQRIAEVQDIAWRNFAAAYADGGFLPIKSLAVGRPISEPDEEPEGVMEWEANVVPVDDLVQRTGVAAPPVSKLMPKNFRRGVSVKINVEEDEDGKADEKDGKKEGGGGGADGK